MHHALLCNPWQGGRLYITLFVVQDTHIFKELPQFCIPVFEDLCYKSPKITQIHEAFTRNTIKTRIRNMS